MHVSTMTSFLRRDLSVGLVRGYGLSRVERRGGLEWGENVCGASLLGQGTPPVYVALESPVGGKVSLLNYGAPLMGPASCPGARA